MNASGTGQLEQVEQWQSMDNHQFEGGLWIGLAVNQRMSFARCLLSDAANSHSH